MGLKQAVASRTRDIIFKQEVVPQIPRTITMFLTKKKGCKDMYKIPITTKKESITSVAKWHGNGEYFTQDIWKKIFELRFKVTQESKLQWLHFQILHRIVPTNYYLFNLKIISSPNCTFCKGDTETIEHLFYECFEVKNLWRKLEEWVQTKFGLFVSFDIQSILFGKFNYRNIFKLYNLLILTTKQYILSCKYKKSPLLLYKVLEKIIFDRIFVEIYLLLKYCRYPEYERYW